MAPAAAYKVLSGTIALNNIVATIREPLIVLDADLRVESASQSFYEIFHSTPEATERCFLYELGVGQWDLPELRGLLRGVLSRGTIIDNFEVTCHFPSLGIRLMSFENSEIFLLGGDSLRKAAQKSRSAGRVDRFQSCAVL